ncbi:CRP-like cAMP-binding protein [Rhizobium leguminosarum]|nr:CRP-like cAMP-binding protein [Rhizobium leguminosarum]
MKLTGTNSSIGLIVLIDYAHRTTSSLQSRLASTLLRLSAVYGKDAANSGDELIISQNDLAATLPASREKVNQCLRRLRESKIIDGGQGKIRILNRKALEACANGAVSVK